MQINIYFLEFLARPPVRFRPVVFFAVRFTNALPSLKEIKSSKERIRN
jgi:hypothetical protein